MNDKTNERISALLDGQLGRFESRRWTDELVKDDQLSDRMTRYQLIGDALRGELPRCGAGYSSAATAGMEKTRHWTCDRGVGRLGISIRFEFARSTDCRSGRGGKFDR